MAPQGREQGQVCSKSVTTGCLPYSSLELEHQALPQEPSETTYMSLVISGQGPSCSSALSGASGSSHIKQRVERKSLSGLPALKH